MVSVSVSWRFANGDIIVLTSSIIWSDTGLTVEVDLIM